MSEVFLKLLNLSITASWLILTVVIIRPLLKKAPKWINCALWALVAIRLVCPFSFESSLSLVPSAETVNTTHYLAKPYIQSGVDVIDHAANSYLGDHYFEGVTVATRDSLSNPITFISLVWIIGVAVLLLYALISYIKLKKSVGASIAIKDNIMACDEVKSPFILGIMKPVIYVPSSMTGEILDCVINHETAHIKRHDHWWKPLGYLLLIVYWFNPLCWLSYVLLCRDIEMACDEKVIRDMDRNEKAAYSQALLNCNFPRKRIAACPLAFGEVGVKERVKSVLNYKKPAFWIIVVAVIACVAVSVCFMTNPKDNEPDLSFLNYENACSLVADVTDVDTIYYPPTNKNEDGAISIGYVNGNELAKYLDTVSWQKWKAPQEGLSSPGSIEFCISDDYRITVYQKPRWAVVTYGDEVRYYKTHGGDYEDAVKLFYTDSQKQEVTKWFDCLNSDEMIWDGVREINLDEHPGITFRWNYEKLEAVTDKKIVPLYTGMPIWSVYFCDFNNDGRPELCSTLSIGSGMIDNRIIIYDYAMGASYELSDRGQYDYTLNLQNGKLMVEKRRYMQDELLGYGELVFQDNTYQIIWNHESETVEAQIADRPSGLGQNEGESDKVAVYEANAEILNLTGSWLLDEDFTILSNNGIELQAIIGKSEADSPCTLVVKADGVIEFTLGSYKGEGKWQPDGDTGRYVADVFLSNDGGDVSLPFYIFREGPESPMYLVLEYEDILFFWSKD